MGWRTVADARDYSQTRGSTYTVLLMLAERAPDETRVARPGLKLLAQNSRVSVRTAQRCLVELEDKGEIRAVAHRKGGTPGIATEWLVCVGPATGDRSTPEGATSATSTGDTGDETGDTVVHPTKRTGNEPNSNGGYDPEIGRLDRSEIPAAALPVLSPLQSVAVGRDIAFDPLAMIEECRARGDRDHTREAERFAAYYAPGGEGENAPIKSLRGRWRTWLGRAPSKAAAGRRRSARQTGPTSDQLRAAAAEARALEGQRR